MSPLANDWMREQADRAAQLAERGIDEIARAAGALERLRSIRTARATGVIHPNRATGRPFVNIRTQWRRLLEIANGHLPPDEKIEGRAEDMYVLRATGASMLAACGADPVMVCQMMGDAQLSTVQRHYFSSHIDHMQAAVNRLVIV